ncbi:hypothetical protein [Candidatus Puniceispirillum marinum]|uniref:Uncharacterized protein n=1 Tax=Puniceispirillum marinum (strain IMCC1322) TaxID=488538 RepID=D5BPE7_PUNMI|nr:hypothetical protein [Candidatus Puniceispirillum marinum]ADE38429.1 hypothetical protein SAR116_0186 [Candidatus Puniceispirillum marinum IMCC1322]
MQTHLDKEFGYTENTAPFKSSGHALYESVPDGGGPSQLLFPFRHSCHFIGQEIELNTGVFYHGAKSSEPDLSQDGYKEFFRIKLRDNGRAAYGLAVEYQMLGSSKPIEKIELVVRKGKSEHFDCYARIQHESEGPEYQKVIEPDFIIFEITLGPAEFAQVKDHFLSSNAPVAIFDIAGVDGFLAPWTPTIVPDGIKILTDGENHQIEMPDDAKEIFKHFGEENSVRHWFFSIQTQKS